MKDDPIIGDMDDDTSGEYIYERRFQEATELEAKRRDENLLQYEQVFQVDPLDLFIQTGEEI